MVTAETGLLEQVKSHDAGVPIDALDAKAVASALAAAELVRPDSWPRLSSNAHALAVSIGNWTTIARQIRSLYKLG
jgi:hypothetical protein